MATPQLPGQDIPIQLPDRQIEPVWYGWFRYVGTSVKSLLADTAGYESAWTAYTPTVTAGGGTITAYTASGRYKMIGKTVFVAAQLTITTNGTGSAFITFTLPATVFFVTMGTGYGVPAAKVLSVHFTAATANVVNYDGTYPAASGASLYVSGVYEAA